MSATSTLLTIVKRNGQTVPFDAQKITFALMKAGKATGEFDAAMAQTLTLRVINILQQLAFDESRPTVERVQDTVEEVLLTSPYRKTAKAYIIYREQHSQIRQIASQFNANLVSSYLNREDWKVNENSNMAFFFAGVESVCLVGD